MALTDSGGLVPTMPVQPANNYSGGMGMWGQDWIWIIVLFLFGWGRNGFSNGSGVTDGYVLASDFSNIERKIDGVNSGVCDGFYAMNTGMLNGFAGVTQAVTSGFSQSELARCNQQAALMQQRGDKSLSEALVRVLHQRGHHHADLLIHIALDVHFADTLDKPLL